MLTRRNLILGAVALGVIGAVGGIIFLSYVYFAGGSGEASREIEAQSCEGERASSDQQLFRIVQSESEVRFKIDEELGGRPGTVVGTTQEVAGEILIDVETPANTIICPITINLRTLQTDQELRNRAIRARILKSAEDQYEFTDFVPTALEGLPTRVTIGEPFVFRVIGDLTLLATTHSLTFEATVTAVSEDRIEGFATTTIKRDDFNIDIGPTPPTVANVSDTVILEIQFVATHVTDETTPATPHNDIVG